jgi:flagella basal body P-ring formation protein FlgA
MVKNRCQMSGISNQESVIRIKKTLICVLFSILSLFIFDGSMSAEVIAASWTAEDVLQTFLAENYPWEKIEISNVKMISAGPDRVPDTINVEKGPLGKAVFSFFYDDSQKATVTAEVRAFDTVVRSKRPFNKGHVLNNEDLYLSEMDIKRMPVSSVKDPETIIGKSLKRSITANITVTEDMVEKSQVVDKGKQVVLLINAHGFNITAAGETREKGYVGKAVKAINLSSKREVRGVLINERTVKVGL